MPNKKFHVINSFSGENRWLSNFWPAPVRLDGITYPTVENAYQASKTLVAEERKRFISCPPWKAKRLGRYVSLRVDWEEVKLATMEKLLLQKFSTDPLRSKLVRTFNSELIEGNNWGDSFWGVCRGTGTNHLGKLLMKIRSKETKMIRDTASCVREID